MKMNQIIEYIKNFYKNPIKLFGLFVIMLSLILFFGCQFHFPDFYVDKELADNIAQTVAPSEVYEAVEHLLNPKYDIYNGIFQVWGYSVVVFIFSIIFQIKKFNDFKEVNILNKKLFVYIWINLSYIIGSCFYVSCYMTDLEKYVYNGAADSMGIPFFSMIGSLIFLGLIYYPIINIIAFITYNTKIKRIFYNILWAAMFLLLAIIACDMCSWHFTYINLFLDFIYFVWFLFIVYAIGYTKNK